MVAQTTQLRDAFTAKRTCMTAFRPHSLNVTILLTQRTGLTELFPAYFGRGTHSFVLISSNASMYNMSEIAIFSLYIDHTEKQVCGFNGFYLDFGTIKTVM